MASSFEVRGAFALEERGLFALSGEIREGMVQTGMLAVRGDASDAGFSERIHSVEFLDRPAAAGLPTLTFHYRDRAKLERWMKLGWEGQTLAVRF